MNKRSKWFFIFFLFFSFSLFFPIYGLSAPLSLQDVIKWGISHNNTLQEIAYQIQTTKRELKEIEAEMDWQVDLSGKYDSEKLSTSLSLSKDSIYNYIASQALYDKSVDLHSYGDVLVMLQKINGWL